jgi:capsule polysaccharide export protein KpsE/RkpR
VSANPEAELGAALTVRTGLEAQLQAKLVELDTFQQFMGPENPRLLAVQSEVAELRKRLAQSVDPNTGAAGPNAGELTELTSQYVNLYRDYVFAQSIYQIYSRISEEVAVQELSGRTAATVQVVEAPHLDAWRHYNVSAVAALALLILAALFTEIYAPATGIVLWRSRDRVTT